MQKTNTFRSWAVLYWVTIDLHLRITHCVCMCAKKCECDEVPCYSLILIQTCNKLMHSTNYSGAPKVRNPLHTLYMRAVCCSCSRVQRVCARNSLADAHKVKGSKKSPLFTCELRKTLWQRDRTLNDFSQSVKNLIGMKQHVTKSRKCDGPEVKN